MFNEDLHPPAKEMYEHLGDFSPECDLDEPVIKASPSGTSPTSAEAAQPFPAILCPLLKSSNGVTSTNPFSMNASLPYVQ